MQQIVEVDGRGLHRYGGPWQHYADARAAEREAAAAQLDHARAQHRQQQRSAREQHERQQQRRAWQPRCEAGQPGPILLGRQKQRAEASHGRAQLVQAERLQASAEQLRSGIGGACGAGAGAVCRRRRTWQHASAAGRIPGAAAWLQCAVAAGDPPRATHRRDRRQRCWKIHPAARAGRPVACAQRHRATACATGPARPAAAGAVRRAQHPRHRAGRQPARGPGELRTRLACSGWMHSASSGRPTASAMANG